MKWRRKRRVFRMIHHRKKWETLKQKTMKNICVIMSDYYFVSWIKTRDKPRLFAPCSRTNLVFLAWIFFWYLCWFHYSTRTCKWMVIYWSFLIYGMRYVLYIFTLFGYSIRHQCDNSKDIVWTFNLFFSLIFIYKTLFLNNWNSIGGF